MKKKSCQASFSDHHLWATEQSFKGQSLLCFLEILCSIAQVGMQGPDGEVSMEECGIHIIEGQRGGEEERNNRQLVTGKQTFFQRDLLLPWCISLFFFK